MSFHLFLPQMRMPVDVVVDRALAAEAAGFEGIALMDHLAPPMAAQHDMWEAMTLATWLLARTQSLVVGHLVLCDPLRHPAVLARQAATLDHASGGRYELGIGWGSVPDELDTFGVGAAPARERVARLGESLDVMRALWTGEPVTYDGRFFRLQEAQQRPVPTRRIPVVVGGVGERTLEVVRAHADWWNVPIQSLGRLDDLRDRVGGARVSAQVMAALVPTEADRIGGDRAGGPPVRRLDHGGRRRRRHDRRAGRALRGPARPRGRAVLRLVHRLRPTRDARPLR